VTGVRFDFTGASALVTGGTSGIGHAVACALRDAGARVAVTGRRAAPGDYELDLGGLDYRRCDMADHAAVAALPGALGRLDVLVNNAGENLPGGRDEWDPDVFDASVAANLSGAFRLAVACRPLLAASGHDGGGNVVNVASMASFFGIPIVPGYGAAKAGVVQMTKTLAVAWAREGVRVNAVAPGVVRTRMTAPMMDVDAITGPLLARTPLGRFAEPADVVPAVLFLASGGARYVTGHTLVVDGGFSVAG
jgi:NAD(P)-dependent dehydrogenase (short-subunit alcohol dehydrogenase family)